MLYNVLLKPVIPSGVCKVKRTCQLLQVTECNLPLGFPEPGSHVENAVERSCTPQTHWGGFSSFQ